MSFSRSLVPQMLRPTSDWWDLWDFPPRIFDQHFGLGLNEEDLIPLASSPFYPRSSLLRRQLSSTSSSGTNATQSTTTSVVPRGVSEVSNVSNQFAVSLDVSQFAPNEITVKAIDNNCVVIEGKHEERPDEHGYISRHFQRRYMLPKGIEADKIISSLSPEGVLTVSVPKKAPIEEGKPKEKVIPINFGSSPMVVDYVQPSTPGQLASSSQTQSANNTNTSTSSTTTNQQETIHQIQVESSVQQSSNIVQQPIQQTEAAKPVTEATAAAAPAPATPAEPQQPAAPAPQ